MNIEQLEAFVHVATTGSFSKAGDILFLSQPSVSSRIKVLEDELQATLFKRVGSKVYLSEEGKLFLPYAQQVLKNIQEGKRSIKRMSNTFNGEVLLATYFSGANYVLPEIVKEFNILHPQIKLIIYSGHSNQVLDMVLNNEVTFGIVRSIFHPQIETTVLKKDQVILVCHPDHPFRQLKQLTTKELANAPFILFKRETFDWELIHNAFKRKRVEPNIVVEVDSIEGAKQMVKKNIGASFLPHSSVLEELEKGDLYTLDVSDMPAIHRNFELIYRKEETFDAVTKLFFDFIVQRYQTNKDSK